MSHLQDALAYLDQQRGPFLEELKELIRIPSVSTLPEYQEDVLRAAQWLVDQLKSMDFESISILPTARHPVVYGEWLKAGSDAPLVLVYGHYDVQPPDPLDEWQSDPFDPVIRGDNLFGRGASDMKSQIVAHLKAIESIQKTGQLPVNIKYILEGEEEIGSPNLKAFISENRARLTADFCLNCDGGIVESETPAITYGLRGLAYFELRLQGAAGDLHSGLFGGAIDNPALVLCELLAGLRDENGLVTLPGFYDKVRPLSDDERSSMFSQSDAWWLKQSGAKLLYGDPAYTTTERATSRPTLDVNGLLSGFTGEGSKTVLPSKAMAKISMRLVPDQRPEDVKAALETYLEANAPPSVTWELEEISSCSPSISERDSEWVSAATRSFQAVWGKEPLFVRTGGSVPVVGLIQDLLGIESLIMGFGLPDDNIHAPNEKQSVKNFYRGIKAFIHFMLEIAPDGVTE